MNKLNKGYNVKYFYWFLFLFVLINLIGIWSLQHKERKVPKNDLLYICESYPQNIFKKVSANIQFNRAIDAMYESKEHYDYTYTENDLLLAKEYRLYTTDKEKLFKRIFKNGDYKNSIIIPSYK